MSLRSGTKADVRRSRYKVAVDADEGRRRREDNMGRAVHRHMAVLMRALGPSCSELLLIISNPPNGSEDLLIQVLQLLCEGQTPPPDLVVTVKHLYETRLKDAAILIPILSAFSKEECPSFGLSNIGGSSFGQQISLRLLLLVRCVNYSDEVYDDSSVDRPTFRWRYRNFSGEPVNHSKLSTCENELKPPGSESLPKGIVAKTSNLERRPLWGLPEKTNGSRSLFVVAVGVKQKINVDKMVRKFLESGFVVMLLHYDGIVDEWKDFGWSSKVIHVSVDNQTKWWFAKRFLHPDIVAEYNYIFLWDEDLGVENFNPQRYLSIVKEEGFEISQPALDSGKSEVHHLITTRSRRSKVHTRAYKSDGKGVQCDDTSSSPPCTGNDLIHAWGLDIRLGYCAQASERWIADCFNDTEMLLSTEDIGCVFGESDVQIDITELGNTPPPEPECDVNVVDKPPVRTSRNVAFKGRKSFMRTPPKQASSVVYPFTFIKPCSVHGDMTLNDINQQVHNPRKPKQNEQDDDSISYQTSAFSGKPVLGKTKIRTEGGEGCITILRTKG
ncbi:hypothetical protein CASFOL_029825 [Castilleja foliolosa]|uniref:Uncharacterized protein n=1 Tax=Castilleja foliolosa TaxID=1961234 RepID=A0ABD3CB22_9LAMI